jgi:hypothetical protein
MVLPTDEAAVEAAIATIGPVDADSLRLVHITNTKDLASVEISAALLAAAELHRWRPNPVRAEARMHDA